MRRPEQNRIHGRKMTNATHKLPAHAAALERLRADKYSEKTHTKEVTAALREHARLVFAAFLVYTGQVLRGNVSHVTVTFQDVEEMILAVESQFQKTSHVLLMMMTPEGREHAVSREERDSLMAAIEEFFSRGEGRVVISPPFHPDLISVTLVANSPFCGGLVSDRDDRKAAGAVSFTHWAESDHSTYDKIYKAAKIMGQDDENANKLAEMACNGVKEVTVT
jgi:6,7-dimethyl-8-ribityllumazine synthase